MSKPIKKILLATDLSEASRSATTYAFQLSRSLGADLTLLHVFDSNAWIVPAPFYFMPSAEQWVEEHLGGARHKAQELLDGLTATYGDHAQVLLLEGKPGPTIVDCAKEQDVDLIIVGTHGRTGLSHAFLGSIAGHVARSAHCSVITIKEHEVADDAAQAPLSIKKIMVPVDFSSFSKSALHEAVALATQHNAELQLVHVINHLYLPTVYEQYAGALEGQMLSNLEQSSQEELQSWLKENAPESMHYSVHVLMGGAADRIRRFAADEHSDIIVLSTHGNTGIKRFLLGSVTEQVLRYVECPVMVVRD